MAHTAPVSIPQPHPGHRQWDSGAWIQSLPCQDAHDSSPCPSTCDGRPCAITPDTERRQLYNQDSLWPPSSCYSSQACDLRDPGHEARAHHPSDNSSYGRSKAAMTPDAKEAARKAQSHSSYRDCGGWNMRALKDNQRHSERETKNLCYSATYQKSKRKNCNI